jgi:hypothetical protein
MKLTQEYLQNIFTLNTEKGELYWNVRRSGIKLGALAGCFHKGSNRWIICVDRKPYYRARLIFLYVYGCLPREVDHRDRNRLNDRPSNLRDAKDKNPANRSIQAKNVLGEPRSTSTGKTKPSVTAPRPKKLTNCTKPRPFVFTENSPAINEETVFSPVCRLSRRHELPQS